MSVVNLLNINVPLIEINYIIFLINIQILGIAFLSSSSNDLAKFNNDSAA